MISEWLQLCAVILGAYLLGAIPSGLLVGLLMGRNLLQLGSGKTGTANTMSMLGKPAAATVFALDLAKGVLAVLIARTLAWPDDNWLAVATGLAASAAIVGHNWSVWVRLFAGKWGGGRGIVTAVGAMLVLQPLIVLAAVIAGAVALLLSRYVVIATLAGVVAGVAAAVVLALLQQITPWLLPGVIAWSLLIVAGFQDSLSRLLKGTETRLG